MLDHSSLILHLPPVPSVWTQVSGVVPPRPGFNLVSVFVRSSDKRGSLPSVTVDGPTKTSEDIETSGPEVQQNVCLVCKNRVLKTCSTRETDFLRRWSIRVTSGKKLRFRGTFRKVYNEITLPKGLSHKFCRGRIGLLEVTGSPYRKGTVVDSDRPYAN